MASLQEADVNKKGYLDFTDFQRFVKLLKARPELTRLYKKVCGSKPFDYAAFVSFMRDCQKVSVTESTIVLTTRIHASSVWFDLVVYSPPLLSDP